MSIVSIDKYQAAKLRAQERARMLMDAMANDPTYVAPPPEFDLSNQIEKMITDTLYQIEKMDESKG